MSKGIKRFIEKLGDDKGFVVAIVIALFIVSYLLLSYFLVYRPIPEGYSTISLLDSQQKAINYPEYVVLNQNNTFNVWVTVENHMGQPEKYQVLMKITNSIGALPINVDPVNTYQKDLADGEKWNNEVTVTLNQTGNYFVAFELWIYNPDTSTYEMDNYNLVTLSVQVVN